MYKIIKKIKTSKFHIHDILFLPIIMVLWEPFSGKRSHWWNWSNYEGEINKGVKVNGEKGNHPLSNLWHVLYELNFRWSKVVIFRPINYLGEYQIVYRNSVTEICSLLVSGKVACLVPSSDTIFTAISYPDGNEIELEILGYSDKKDLDENTLFI